MMQPEIDDRWRRFGITAESLEAKAEWLRAPRTLASRSVRFFDLAGSLVSHSRFDYPLAGLAFFQAVIGLERALKLHYHDDEEHLAPLLRRALRDSLVRDSLFSSIPKLSEHFLKHLPVRPQTYSETLTALVPELRNRFFHDNYLLAPEYLPLTIQLREIADTLTTKTDPARVALDRRNV